MDVTKLVEESIAVAAVSGVCCIAAHLAAYDDDGHERMPLLGRYAVGTLAIATPTSWWLLRTGRGEAVIVLAAAAFGAGLVTASAHWMRERMRAAVCAGMDRVYDGGGRHDGDTTVPVPFRRTVGERHRNTGSDR